MSGWRDFRDPRERPEPRYLRPGDAWQQRKPNDVRDFRTVEREYSAHPASRLYRGYLNPDYTVQSLGKDPPAIKHAGIGHQSPKKRKPDKQLRLLSFEFL
ncbi:ABC transporter G family member 20-like [Tropilaelaps mercedesae]|uniref:ABC transporter G family member 20-like n=1 Tax=Tropilaelaps mercedesae TaxID=418985 RepID=A0A1V9XIY8_9ACAR|nr:ABC transporter G family member 20-like [Tropilaelaps mercedesae]